MIISFWMIFLSGLGYYPSTEISYLEENMDSKYITETFEYKDSVLASEDRSPKE